MTWDVIVIGAGPAGTSAASVLAARGARVVVLEKDDFPRFHIGESLLPASSVLRDVLHLAPDPDVYAHKQGAEFVCERTGRRTCFDFAEALPGPPRHAYHVERAAFDTQLRDRAVELGAVVRHGVHVTSVDVDAQRVTVRSRTGSERGRFVIDATGQQRLMGKQERSVRPYGRFGKAASFTWFEDVTDETIAVFSPRNDIRIMMVDGGWAWVIPLPGRRLSVGIVSREQSAIGRESVRDYVRSSPLLRLWTTGARARPSQLVGNFSFYNRKSFGPRFACIGDAACFVDPVFSSGVSLALQGGVRVGEHLAAVLASGRDGDARAMAPVFDQLHRYYAVFAALVDRFYNTRFVDNLLFGAPEESELRPSVISVLAGDVLRDDNPFRDMLIRSHKRAGLDPGEGDLSPDTHDRTVADVRTT